MNRNFWHIWTIPIILAILSLFGLISALVGDGLMDYSILAIIGYSGGGCGLVYKPTAGKAPGTVVAANVQR
jgi:hypothetical protein